MASQIEEHDGTADHCTTNYNPRLLKKSAGAESCFIFRVPHNLAQIDNKAYKPKIVSIGPYHHKEKQMQMIQEHKHRFLKLFTDKGNLSQKQLEDMVGELEDKIRKSYSEELDLTKEELVEMMVLDGCFILVLFLVKSRKIVESVDDPIFNAPWIVPSLLTDLLLLENQVPFFLLKTIIKKLRISTDSNRPIDLNNMARIFFDYSLGNANIDLSLEIQYNSDEPYHLLDFIRRKFIPESSSPKKPSHNSNSSPKFILSAKTLYLKGINFQPNIKAKTLVDIKLENNKFHIPRIVLDGSTSLLFFNCVAFEQYYKHCSNDITSYIVFMGFLMKDKDDATFLCKKHIIENCLGTDEELSQFFKNTCKGVTFDLTNSYLAPVYEGVNKYTSKCYTGYWADFRHTHFTSPWTITSLCAGILVICLTVTQVWLKILSYNNDK
ncbi:hypothetical protein V5N11_011383 [Cardamine amara subsp. amara]|uniref:Uncharacterized protein n=1 Tax=Cardamine amara subsp. amara TaxID=228776 RepID=A0ABD1A0K8_CARAN